MIEHRTPIVPRLSDLDTQRHVTSRSYEQFCWQGRHELLAEHGYDLTRLLEERILLVPFKSYVKFYREQMPGNPIEVLTRAHVGPKNIIYWVQEIYNIDNCDLACRLITVTKSRAKNKGIELLADQARLQSEKELQIDGVAVDVVLKKPKTFSGNCKRVKSPFVTQYSARSYFFDYPPSEYWRIMEEGRWAFGQKLGFTQKTIEQIDTTTFFTGGTYYWAKIPEAGQELVVYTWVEKIDNIRCFLRQDVHTKKGDQFIFCIREEQLIVSLSKRRPRKAPLEWVTMVKSYIEE